MVNKDIAEAAVRAARSTVARLAEESTTEDGTVDLDKFQAGLSDVIAAARQALNQLSDGSVVEGRTPNG